MSRPQPMASVRRRPIPGMASQPVTTPPPIATDAREPQLTVLLPATEEAPTAAVEDKPGQPAQPATPTAPATDRRRRQGAEAQVQHHRSADYASTKLVNFRIPVDLHKRFQQLVRDAETRHPRLRRQSLTELMIALLEEGPQTADGVAELIRRKRAAEHEER
jgi:hypothetical protein